MPRYWFDHVHLMSPDPIKTARVYEKMFGAKQVSVQDLGGGMLIVNVNLNGTTILISPQRSGDKAQGGLHHFGIGTDNLEKAASELKAQGVKFTMDVTQIKPGVKISFLTAPDNVAIELQEGSV